jgi:hypothetical protein
MIDEHNLVTSDRSEGDAHKSSHSAELSLNAAILRAEISRSYEEFLDIFETFYADDVEVSREDLRGVVRQIVVPYTEKDSSNLVGSSSVCDCRVIRRKMFAPREPAPRYEKVWSSKKYLLSLGCYRITMM